MPKIKFHTDENVGIITLDNPPLNLISTEVVNDLVNIITTVENSQIRSLILRADGDLFTAGIQVDDVFKGKSQTEAFEMLKTFNQILDRFEKLPIPTIAVIQGNCLTIGIELMLACDFAWAADSANFGQVEAVIGYIPTGGAIPRLTERAGKTRAAEIIMGADFYKAEIFEKWNIINRVLPRNDLDGKALRFAKKLAQGPTLAYAATKKVIRETIENGFTAADRFTAEIASPLYESEDMKNGVESLLLKGPGHGIFKGK